MFTSYYYIYVNDNYFSNFEIQISLIRIKIKTTHFLKKNCKNYINEMNYTLKKKLSSS